MEPLEFLAQHAPFDRLDASGRRLLGTALEIAYAPPGSVVLTRGGAVAERLYVVRKGTVRLERDGQVQQVIEAGECFGFPSLIGRAAPTADAVAADDTLLYQVPRDAFDLLMERREFADFFLLDLGARLRQATAGGPSATLGTALAAEVGRLIDSAPVYVEPTRSVEAAAALMQASGVSALLVTGTPLGILTDADLRNRVLAVGRGPSTTVDDVATRPVKTIAHTATLIEVLAFMLDHRVHHAVVDEGGRIAGVLTDTDLLRLQVRSPLALLRGLDRLAIPGDLPRYASDLAAMVESLLWSGLDALQIAPLVSRMHDALTARLIVAAAAELGPSPALYAWMVHGAEGRMEQSLLTDQDNALASADASPELERYLAALAARVVEGLAAAGVAPCGGGFMATNWRYPLDEWVRRFRGWQAAPSPRALIAAMNLFDFRRVHGTLDLAPLQATVLALCREPLFMAHLARASLGLEPPIGLLRQIREEDEGVDLKKGAIVPIVNLARLYALDAQAVARSTSERLAAAEAAGTLSAGAASMLHEAFRFTMGLRLRTQLGAVRAGMPPTHHVRLAALSSIDGLHLKQVFHEVRQLQAATAVRYGTDRLA